MLFFNALISLLAETGMHICALIAIWMVNSRLGLITLMLYSIKEIANYMMRLQYEKEYKKLLDKAEKL